MQKISDCCGAAAKDPIMLDYMICPECKDHCEYVYDREELAFEMYSKLKASGMMWEFHPELSGDWQKDKLHFLINIYVD